MERKETSFEKQCPNRLVFLQNHRGTISRDSRSLHCGQVSSDLGRPVLLPGAGAMQKDTPRAGRLKDREIDEVLTPLH